MALSKETVVDQITVTENGTVLYREAITVKENGSQISKTFHRTSLTPGQDIAAQPEKVQSICNAAWTPEVIEAYKAQLEANQKV